MPIAKYRKIIERSFTVSKCTFKVGKESKNYNLYGYYSKDQAYRKLRTIFNSQEIHDLTVEIVSQTYRMNVDDFMKLGELVKEVTMNIN